MSHSRLLPLISFIILLSASPLFARQWTDSTGTYRVEADLVTLKDGKAYLEKTDKTVITVPLTKLSKEDLRYLNDLPECKAYFKKHPIPGLEAPAAAAESKPKSEETHPSAKESESLPEEPAASIKGTEDSSAAESEEPAPRESNTIPKSAIQVENESVVGPVRHFLEAGGRVESLAFSPDGRFLAAGETGHRLRILNVDTGYQVANREDFDELETITCLAFSPDGNKLLAGGSNGSILVWDVPSNGHITRAGCFQGHSKAVYTITVGADGKTVLSGGRGCKVRCWDLTTQRERFVLDVSSRTILATYVTRSGKQGLASDGAQVTLIDMKTGEPIQMMVFNSGLTDKCAIAPDGSRIVICDRDEIRATEIKSGNGPVVLSAEDRLREVKFHPGSRYLLSGSSKKIDLWDIESGSQIHSFACDDGSVKCIAVSPDHHHFAAASSGSRSPLVVYRLPPQVYSATAGVAGSE